MNGMVMNGSYYSKSLSAERLERCYEVAPPRVQKYLEEEIRHVHESLRPGMKVLELGCGYGRVLRRLAESEDLLLIGIDISMPSLVLARRLFAGDRGISIAIMNALHLGFPDGVFDLVFCIQNGISAFHIDQRLMMREAVRVTKSGGAALFSTYADGFWEDRLEWFRVQAAYGLIGEIDEIRTGNGVIVCKDGFRATTLLPDQFAFLTEGLGSSACVRTVDDSSLFCEIKV